MKKWKYMSENIPGNMHEAAAWISQHHPEWDVVAMNSIGHYTIVVHRRVVP